MVAHYNKMPGGGDMVTRARRRERRLGGQKRVQEKGFLLELRDVVAVATSPAKRAPGRSVKRDRFKEEIERN